MSKKINELGSDWIIEQMDGLTEKVTHVTPTQYNEEKRYLPASVSSIAGFIRYDVNPFMREIVDCFDVNSPVREVNLMKGVQITYTTALESGIMYFAGHIKTLPMMYITADKELAKARIENNIVPMFNESDMGHIIRTSDTGNTRKTGKTANHLQFAGGSYLVPFGAKNADKMRSFSICVMLKDEIDAWPEKVGKDGDPDKLSDSRCDGFWERRKIFRGSTPLIDVNSKIYKQYKRGDQRKYMVLCFSCGYPQDLRWETKDKDTGVVGGFQWDLDEDGMLIHDSVRYCCQKCGHPHYEYDKEKLFSEDSGAHWKPTAKPVEPNIRSYHLPALYSPIGMKPWYASVADYLEAYDPKTRKVKDIGKYQVFYNNILGWPFKVQGSKVRFESVSRHRRSVYRLGEIPNTYAAQYSGSPILFLTCQVDVHKSNLAVAVMGWTKSARCYLIDYWRFEPNDDEKYDCTNLECSAWGRLRDLIEQKIYTADDGSQYRITFTVVDAGYETDTVNTFCSDYADNVFPILGRDRPAKYQSIREFQEFETKMGTKGYRITVDHYKDRMAMVLRREWVELAGDQPEFMFNAPIDTSDDQLKELTREQRRKKTDDRTGVVSYYWYRPQHAEQELFDLLGYGFAAVDMIAWRICIIEHELENVDWDVFWDYLEETKRFYYVE